MRPANRARVHDRGLQCVAVGNGEGKKLGTMVSYAGETREIARIGSDAEEVVAALGPEVELGGVTEPTASAPELLATAGATATGTR